MPSFENSKQPAPSGLVAGVVRGFVEDGGGCKQVAPLYEEHLFNSLHFLQHHEPPFELTSHWDLPEEKAALEFKRGGSDNRYWKAYFYRVEAGILDCQPSPFLNDVYRGDPALPYFGPQLFFLYHILNANRVARSWS